MKKVSIIVPVYNAEAYLGQCLDSCLGQTLTDIEVIAADDCSTDRSRDILALYAREHPDKVTPVYLERNMGPGGARNAAMDRAQGAYFLFLDSDDWIDPDTCQVLWNAAVDSGADMVGADYYAFRDGADHLHRFRYVSSSLDPDHCDDLARYIMDCGLFAFRLYRRGLIVDDRLCFPEGVKFEDAYFNFLTILCAQSVVKLDRAFYHYRDRPGSLSRSGKDPLAVYDRFAVTERLFEECRDRGLYALYRPVVDLKYLTTAISILYACVHKFETPAYDGMEKIRDGIRRRVPDWKETAYWKLIPPKDRALLRLAMASPRTFVRTVQAIDVVNRVLGRN